jgi:hypothetical protein
MVLAHKGNTFRTRLMIFAPVGRNFLLCHTISQGAALGCVVLALQADFVQTAI